jgi:hypothetical protein
MKPKKVFKKKLKLNKNTIANLNHGQMKGLKGGEISDTCPSLPATCKPIDCGGSLECTATCAVTEEWCSNNYTCPGMATCDGFTCAFPVTCDCM